MLNECDICNYNCELVYIKEYHKHLCNSCTQWYLAFKKLDKLLELFRMLLNQSIKLNIAKNIRLMESDKFWLNNKL